LSEGDSPFAHGESDIPDVTFSDSDILQVNEGDFEVAEEEYWDSEDEYESDDPQSEASDSEGFGE
jgi:hypothetical protein